MAQVEYDMAKENVATTDTLYRTGQERHKIAAISQADLLTLKLERSMPQYVTKRRYSIEASHVQLGLVFEFR